MHKMFAYSKKSQSRIQEMIFMILAVAIFFILVLLFYLSFSLGNLKKTAEAGERSGAILLISQLAGAPEFNCPDATLACVDGDKILGFLNHPEYSRFWDIAGLRIEKIYPTFNGVNCTLGNYPRCSIFTIVQSKSTNVVRDSSYVNICRRESKNGQSYIQCDLGKIIVETERKS